MRVPNAKTPDVRVAPLPLPLPAGSHRGYPRVLSHVTTGPGGRPTVHDSSAAQVAEPVDAFITRWSRSESAERANYQSFLIGLCKLLGVPEPDPAGADDQDNAYVFERAVTF